MATPRHDAIRVRPLGRVGRGTFAPMRSYHLQADVAQQLMNDPETQEALRRVGERLHGQFQVQFSDVPRETMDVIAGRQRSAPPPHCVQWEPEFVLIGVRNSAGEATIIKMEPESLRARVEVEEAHRWDLDDGLTMQRMRGPVRYSLRADTFRMTFATGRTFGGALRRLFGRTAHMTVEER